MHVVRHVVFAALVIVMAGPIFVGLCALESMTQLGTGKAAQAQDFDTAARLASKVRSSEALGTLLWSYVASCDSIESDFERRQCLGVRQARQTQIAGKTFVIDGEATALAAGEYDPKKRSVELTVRGCVACARPVSVLGRPLHIVATGGEPALTSTAAGMSVLGPEVHALAIPFKDASAASTWRADVFPRLRVQLLFRVPPGSAIWSRSDVQGMSVDVIGYRVYDPCTGKIVVSKPKNQPMPVDENTCTGDDLFAVMQRRAAEEAAKAPKPAGPAVPEKLTPVDIQEALKPAGEAAQECYALYSVPGEARFRIVINQDGNVTAVEQLGDFVDTPTGTCIEQAVKKTVFPKTQKTTTTVNYPFTLR